MSENDANTSNNMSGEQNNGNVPGNAMAFALPPGAVLPYFLPNANDVDEPFEPISSYAIMESGQFGPLTAEQLKDFLRHKLDRRMVSSKDVVLQYTANIVGLRCQLINLRNRMNQIRTDEKDKTAFMKKRIRDFITALRENKPLPNFVPPELILSLAVNEAFSYIGSQGPLNENQLRHFIHHGIIPDVPRNDIIDQLRDLRLKMEDTIDYGKHKFKFPYERVLKAINDITEEIINDDA